MIILWKSNKISTLLNICDGAPSTRYGKLAQHSLHSQFAERKKPSLDFYQDFLCEKEVVSFLEHPLNIICLGFYNFNQLNLCLLCILSSRRLYEHHHLPNSNNGKISANWEK